MARNINDKYGANRNLWRIVYPYNVRREPQVTQISIPGTGVTYSLDFNKTARHRDYFKVITFNSTSAVPFPVGEYDEGLIHFNSETSKAFSFNFVFTSTPVVVFTIESPASGVNPLLTNTEYINAYGLSKSTTGSIAGVSAPYSGTVRYRAIFSSDYPTVCTSSFSASFVCSAGTFTPTSIITAYTASYDDLEASPSIFLETPWDTGSVSEADVFLSRTSMNSAQATAEISAEIDSDTSIDFISYV